MPFLTIRYLVYFISIDQNQLFTPNFHFFVEILLVLDSERNAYGHTQRKLLTECHITPGIFFFLRVIGCGEN